MKRRTIIKLAVCVVLGFMTTVGVAWFLHENPMTIRFSYGHRGELARQITVMMDGRSVQSDRPHTLCYVHEAGWLGVRMVMLDGDADLFGIDEANELLLSDEARRQKLVPTTTAGMIGQTSMIGYCTDAGFPCRCLRTWALSDYRTGENRLRRDTPDVLYFGLLANIAFYSALWALPIFVIPGILPAARRHRRRARGHCAFCNYDRAGLTGEAVCPECGRPQQSKD